MTNPTEQHSHCVQQGSTQDRAKDPGETKIGNNSMEAPGSGKIEQRSREDFSDKNAQQEGGDPDNLSETTGGCESGGEHKGAKR